MLFLSSFPRVQLLMFHNRLGYRMQHCRITFCLVNP